MNRSTSPQPLPRVAGIAGLLFSLLMLISLGIFRAAVPDVPEEQSIINTRFGHALTLTASGTLRWAGVPMVHRRYA